MKVVVLDAATLGQDIDLSPICDVAETVIYQNTADSEIKERISDANVILTNKKVLDESNLKDAKNLGAICVFATGYNNIDIDFCKKNNILVKNVPAYSTNSVAQHTFAILLALIENINYYDTFTKDGRYTESKLANHIGRPYFEISNKKWGIIGMGNIGREVAKIATAFGAEVSYARVSGKDRKEEYKEVSLKELLGESDIISIHSPLNDMTNNLINKETLALMKKSAVIVNVGRGAIVNDADLVDAIDNGNLAGAALDVYEKEPFDLSSPLLKIKNKDKLIMTPHIAWASIESRKRCISEVAANVKAFIEGKKRNDVW